MAGFYLDNDVSLRLVHDLRMSGHHVVSALELDLTKATDDEHLLVAVLRSLILVTHNRKDFTLLHDAWQRWPRVLGVSLPRHLVSLSWIRLPLTSFPKCSIALCNQPPQNP